MTKKTLKDADARQAIRTRLEENFLVEAGAGSGKTTCLVDRIAALLAGGFCQPERLAAVTFTRKAAGELKEKFQIRLEDMFRQETDSRVKKNLGEALDKMERIFVGTIHSFCARLLRERPVEAGIAPDFAEIEGLEEKLLEEMAWEEYLMEVRFNRGELLEQLRELDLSPGDVKGAFQKLNLYPDVEMASLEIPYPDFSEARKKLLQFCRQCKKLLPSRQPSGGWDKLQKTTLMVLRWQRVFDLKQDRCLIRLLEKMDRNADPTYNRWPSKDDAQKLWEAFKNLRENQIQPAIRAWLEYRHYHLLKFLLPAAKHYGELRRQENKLNFQDLLMLTAELLKNNPEVRKYFQEKYTHLLVDEFQDTDPIQAEIMFYLTGTDLSERDWINLNPHSGSLFVVGDPKQSIYRFRRADIDIYNRVKEIIRQSGGEVLYLTTNFRSLPEMIDWTNQVFDNLFTPILPPYQADFVPMDPVRGKDPDTGCGVFKLVLEDVHRNSPERIAWQDACKTANWIYLSLNGNLSLSRTEEEKEKGLGPDPLPGDFLILVHYKKYMSFYARALEAWGIPFALSGGGDISDSAELKELVCLLQAIADPNNPVPLAAALRGLLFGISDDSLYRFKMNGGNFSFLSRVPAGLEEEDREMFITAWETLYRYWTWTRKLPPSSVVERIMTELGIIPLALAEELGRGRAGYLLQALELLRQRERQGKIGFPQAVEFLERMLEEGLEEELDIEGGGTSTVRIMNLHKAKGLEAPVVILANPGRNPSHDPDLHVVREAEEARGYMVMEKSLNYGTQALAIPPEWEHYQEEERKYQEAEGVRLLYVAATRAKDMLVVSTYPKSQQVSPWQPLEKFLNGAEDISLEKTALLPQGEEREPVTLSVLEETRDNMEETLEKMVSSTYKRLNASEAKDETKAPQRTADGRGMRWGTMIHAALEILLKENPVEDESEVDKERRLKGISERVIQQQGEHDWNAGDVLEVMKKVVNSPLWRRVTASPEKYAEVPFGYWEQETYIKGTVDLAFREKEGWVLVDYKTDIVKDENHLNQLAEYYAPQVEIYRRSWEHITGEKVKEAGMFFTDPMRCITLSETKHSSHF